MRLILSVLCMTLFCPLAMAQNSGNGRQPVEITADGAIEWQRDAHLYRARGRAMVKQGDTTIQADVIEAAYDPAKGEQDIQTVTATGHVSITSQSAGQTRTIQADQGVYNMTTGELVLTGQDLRITTPDMMVTAQQALSYDRTANKATARGNAVIKTPERTLKAQAIDAWFNAKNELSRATAKGHVTITTAQEILQADQADYNTVTQQAVMTGNVRLTRGENHLQGGRAVVNLKTGVSQLFGNTDQAGSEGGRVRALFFPGSSNSPMPGNATDSMIPMRPGQKAVRAQDTQPSNGGQE